MSDGKIHYQNGLAKHPETGIYIFRFCRRGKVYTGSTDTTRYSDAVDYMNTYRSQLALEKIGVKKQKLMTVKGVFESWLRTCAPTLSPKYVRNVSFSFKHHVLPYVGARQVGEIDKFVAELRNKLLAKGLAKSYAQTLGLQIGAVLSYAREKGWITTRPIINNIKVEPKVRPVVTKKNLDLFLATVDERNNLDFSFMVRAMLFMGMRSEEVILMQWHCYRPESSSYVAEHVKGGNATPTMPIPGVMLPWFEKVREKRKADGILSPWICPSPRDSRKHRCRNSVSDMLDRVSEKLGLGRVTRHRLRASFATMLHQDGVPIKTIQKLMRHKRIETTMTYIAVEHSELQDAVNEVFG